MKISKVKTWQISKNSTLDCELKMIKFQQKKILSNWDWILCFLHFSLFETFESFFQFSQTATNVILLRGFFRQDSFNLFWESFNHFFLLFNCLVLLFNQAQRPDNVWALDLFFICFGTCPIGTCVSGQGTWIASQGNAFYSANQSPQKTERSFYARFDEFSKNVERKSNLLQDWPICSLAGLFPAIFLKEWIHYFLQMIGGHWCQIIQLFKILPDKFPEVLLTNKFEELSNDLSKKETELFFFVTC